MPFIHLHVHSYFSFYDGTAGVEQLVRRAAELGMPALALTDYNGVYGAVRFIETARAVGIKPIIGAEVTVDEAGKLVLLARNLKGYANLCRIISDAMMSDPFEPLVTRESLSVNSGELFALLGNPLGDPLKDGEKKTANRLAGAYLDIFGKDSLVIELQNHGLPGDRERLQSL